MRCGTLTFAVVPLGLALLNLASLPAQATLSFFSNQSAFLAASTGDTTIDFEGIAPFDSYQRVSTPPGLTLSGVNFNVDQSVSNGGRLFVIGRYYYYSANSVLSSQYSSTDDNNLVITLPTAQTAIGLDLGSFYGSPIQFTLSDGSTFSETPPSLRNGLSFVGFTSSIPITSLTLTQSSADVLNIDNFTFGTAVPELSTMLGFGSFLTIGGLAALRQRKNARTIA